MFSWLMQTRVNVDPELSSQKLNVSLTSCSKVLMEFFIASSLSGPRLRLYRRISGNVATRYCTTIKPWKRMVFLSSKFSDQHRYEVPLTTMTIGNSTHSNIWACKWKDESVLVLFYAFFVSSNIALCITPIERCAVEIGILFFEFINHFKNVIKVRKLWYLGLYIIACARIIYYYCKI